MFWGKSSRSEDLIYSAKRSSIFQLNTRLDVFLANNKKENVCDFKVKGSWIESCVFSATSGGSDSEIIVAKVRLFYYKGNWFIFSPLFYCVLINVLLLLLLRLQMQKDMFMVNVYPNIDYAFIISLGVILDAVYKDNLDWNFMVTQVLLTNW